MKQRRIPERVDGQGEAADNVKRGERRAPPRTAVGVVSRVAVILACATGIGLVASPGCGQGGPIDSAANGKETEEPVGEAAQGVVSSQACVTVVRNGASGSVYDAQIANGAGTNKNFGASTSMIAGVSGAQIDQALLEFDLSGIPSGPNTNIVSSVLSLTQSAAAPSGPETISAYQVLAPWTESTVTYTNFAGAYAAVSSGSFTNATTTPTLSLAGLTSAWVRGLSPNYGILLAAPNYVTSYDTSEFAIVADRPSLKVCFTVTCNAGFADCNNNGLDGCETNTTNSPANCGACGHACAEANAVASCVNSTCEVASCNLGFGDCNHNPVDGCETLLTTNANCGACGVPCALPNAVSSCATGTCTLVSCNAGYFDCDGNPNDGCEAEPCVNGSHCANGAGCQSGVCVGGFCASPSCNDGVQNGTETAVDCGGASCPPCANGLTCDVASDCQSGVCTGGICQAPTCNDGVKNGAETAIDCGGPTCGPCANGQVCSVASDCQSGVCTGGICQAPSCNDGVKNGAETSVDCGGGVCPACADGKACLVGADCVDLVCSGGICQIASCHDGVKNGSETDVDCGGNVCPACNAAAACNSGADCASGLCVNNVCQVPTCTPGVNDPAQFGTTTCGVGSCQVTVQNCVNGVVQNCVPGSPAPADLCDGLDENCNGIVDDGCACENGKTQSCYTAAPATLGVGVCQSGIETCAHGQWGACLGEVTPTAEVCDGLDNDCNGQVDDGLGSTTCGLGACQVVTPNCLNGVPQVCTPRPAMPEICDGIDNDCDGVIDNGNPGGGMACSTGQAGVCAAGTTACTNGQIVCNQNVQPSPEVCDGLDNNCNGQVDEGNPGGNAACNTGQLGVCAAGTTVCSGGQLACNQSVQPSPEVCDGLDNNCNGQVDEGNPGGGMACSTGLLGVCAAGTTACTSGQIVCNENVQPSPQQCNGVDDNCDGQVDEGCNCLNGTTQPCYGGPAGTEGVGVCTGGIQTCVNGNFGACVGQVLPSPEVCDGLDNDCNGQTDDGLGTISCGVGQCSRTVPACVAGKNNTCVPGSPSPEICDGLDNDCDGVIDNGNPGGNQACNTGLLGVCAAGKTSCQAGAIICVQQQQATAEVCDGLDNNCNGQVDEGLGSTTCGSGACTVTVQNCVGGVVQACNPNQVNGQSCNDNNACTQTDTCQNGTCTGSNPVVCVAEDQCHVAGVCNPANGTCSNPNANNGTSCNDNNVCTSPDTCTAGVCTGTNLSSGTSCGSGVVCNGSGACVADCFVGGVLYGPGAANPGNQCQECIPGTSTVAFSNDPNGTSCNDNNPCTSPDTCTNGSCAGTNLAVGTSCGAGEICNGSGNCVADCYIGGALYTSGATNPSNHCQQCNPAVSTNSFSNDSAGTACNDGNACTGGDVCNGAGVCAGSNLAAGTSCGAGEICNGSGSCLTDCYIGGVLYASGQLGGASGNNACEVCNPAVSTNSFQAVGVGTSCGAGQICTGGLATCAADCYIGGALYVSGQKAAGSGGGACEVCNSAVSTNSFQAVGVGTSCGAGTICTGALATCAADCYIGGTLYASGQLGAGSGNGACEICTPATSTNAFQPIAVGTSCGAGVICTGAVGTCASDCYIGGTLYATGQANPGNQCQECTPNTSTGAFSNDPSGTGCNDGNACTQTDTCNGAGTCVGSNPVICTPEDACHSAGSCSGGVCSNPVISDGMSATCGGAGTYSVGLGGSTNVSGYILTVGNTDYFDVNFTGPPSPSSGAGYNPTIVLSNSQGGAYTMSVYSAACAGGLCTPATEWEMNYPNNPNSCQSFGDCINSTNPVTSVVVAVTRSSGTSCANYTVSISQPDNP